MKRLVAAFLLLTPLTVPAAAGPLRPGWVSADAKWVAHIDIDAIRDSQIGRFMLEHRDELDIDFGELEEMGIDPAEDFFNVTLYGSGRPEEDGTIILQMNEKIDGIIEHALEEADDFRTIDVLGRTGYSIDDGEMVAYVHRHRSGKRTVVMSKAVEGVADAIRVIEGDRDSLEDGGEFRPRPRDGALFFAQTAGADWMAGGDDPGSQIVRMADGIAVQCGEDGDLAYAHLVVSSKDDENIRNMTDILNGIVAMGRMLASQPDSELAELQHLLDAVSIEGGDGAIRITCAVPIEKLLAFAREAMENHHDEDEVFDHDEDDRHHDDKDDDDWDNR